MGDIDLITQKKIWMSFKLLTACVYSKKHFLNYLLIKKREIPYYGTSLEHNEHTNAKELFEDQTNNYPVWIRCLESNPHAAQCKVAIRRP